MFGSANIRASKPCALGAIFASAEEATGVTSPFKFSFLGIISISIKSSLAFERLRCCTNQLTNWFDKARTARPRLVSLWELQLVAGICRFGTEYEFGITELAHLRNIETCQFRFRRNSL